MQLSSLKSNEKRPSNAISALRRRFVGHSNNSHRRDRGIPEDDHSQIDLQQSETISADDILARYSNKSSDNASKINPIADESHTETITVTHSSSNNSSHQHYFSGRSRCRCSSLL